MVIDNLIDEATDTVYHESGSKTTFFNEHYFANLVASRVVGILSDAGLLHPDHGYLSAMTRVIRELEQE